VWPVAAFGAARVLDRPRRKVRVGSGRPDATSRSRRGRRYARPWRCPDTPDREGGTAKLDIDPAAADGEGQAVGNLQPPQGGHNRAFVNHLVEQRPDRIRRSSPYITRALPTSRGPGSRTAFLPKGFPLGSIEVAELTLFRTGADTLKGSAGLIPVGTRSQG
jgi:hypothetical protein